jgi:hypothetical protein
MLQVFKEKVLAFSTLMEVIEWYNLYKKK